MKRKFKNIGKSILRKMFINSQKLGITILPHHFYSQIPNLSELKKENYWRFPMSMYGVNGIDINEQLDFLDNVCSKDIIKNLPQDIHKEAILKNGEDGGYGVIEADFLYCFIKKHQPKKIIQVGCGVSTAIILEAAKSVNYNPEIVCVEPFPTDFLKKLAKEKQIILIKEKAQKAEIEKLTSLEENDFFFVDSTHTVKVGSEVNRIILEVLPRLKSNVWIHFHDIYFPYDYKRDVLNKDLFFWSESTLLHAFLVNNSKCEIKFSQSMVHYAASEKMKQCLPKYSPQKNNHGLEIGEGEHFPSAIYLKTK